MDTALPNEAISREPFPGSTKVYAQGSDPSIRVPFRAIALPNGEVHTVYDTSGPFTDPDVAIDVRAGIARIKADPHPIHRDHVRKRLPDTTQQKRWASDRHGSFGINRRACRSICCPVGHSIRLSGWDKNAEKMCWRCSIWRDRGGFR